MSISVNGVTRTSPIANSGTGTSPATGVSGAERSAAAADATENKAAGQQATPLRFPWLSRLTAELEPVAKQKPAFPTAPPLGDNLDQAA